MNEYLVSIIVPIYNVEKYLVRCLESIINQSYTNLEIILVDDGSTDDSGKIAERYEKEDNRIRLYHKINGGLSDARNYGLDRMTGEYVTFIDSDDYVECDYVKILVDYMKLMKADISMVDTRVFCVDKKLEPIKISEPEYTFYKTENAIEETLKVNLRQSAWGKLYRKELFENIRFPKGKLYEDLAIVFDVLHKANGLIFVNCPLYNYLVRNNSIMQEKFNEKQLDEICIIENAMNDLELRYPQMKELINSRRAYSYFVVLKRILNSGLAENYTIERADLKRKIQKCSGGLILNKETKTSMRLRLIGYRFGEKGFLFVENLLDIIQKYRQ